MSLTTRYLGCGCVEHDATTTGPFTVVDASCGDKYFGRVPSVPHRHISPGMTLVQLKGLRQGYAELFR